MVIPLEKVSSAGKDSKMKPTLIIFALLLIVFGGLLLDAKTKLSGQDAYISDLEMKVAELNNYVPSLSEIQVRLGCKKTRGFYGPETKRLWERHINQQSYEQSLVAMGVEQ